MANYLFKGVAIAAALGIAAGSPCATAAEGDWLSALSAPLAEAGYRIAWKSMSLDPATGRVEARGLTGTDRSGRLVLRIGAVSVDRPRAGSEGTLQADRLVLDKLEAPGRINTAIGRVVVTRPDLHAVARLLAATVGRRADRSAPAPVDIERLELTDLRQAWTGQEGEPVVVSVGTVRADRLRLDPTAFAVAGDPGRLRPLAVLAATQVELLSAEGLRLQSRRGGITEIARQWIRNDAAAGSRSGHLRYGIEGMRSRPGGALAALAASLFPPHGEVASQWTGDIAYDLPERFVAYSQQTRIDGFGTLDVRADLRAVPDLSVREWATRGTADPRVAEATVNALSVAVTDAGGVDRAAAALGEDDRALPGHLRADAAGRIGTLGPAFNPNQDPRLDGWLRAIQEFVRVGGTLALSAAGPIPLAAFDDPLAAAGDTPADAAPSRGLAGLADRYGLTVTRR